MRSDRVVLFAPLLDDDCGLLQAVEDFTVQAFVAQFAVEGLAVAILPWAAGRYVERLHADPAEPLLHGCSDKFAAIVGPDMRRRPARDEQRVDLARQALRRLQRLARVVFGIWVLFWVGVKGRR